MPVIDLGSVVGPQGVQGVPGVPGVQGIQGNPGPNQVTDQTSTNLNGVLFGNQSRVTVKPVDSDPTADSTNLVSSGGTDKAIKGRVPVYGFGTNLLDNWYFGNPVNQRGLSSYGAVGYTIDRWRIENSRPSLSVASNGVTFGSELVGGQFLQRVESYKLVDGKTYTLSALCTLASGNATIKLAGVDSPYPDFGVAAVATGLSSVTFTLNRGSYSGPIKAFIRNDSANGSVIVHAFKLELGSEQTLCHNEGTDANPVWVLNDVPDYEYELYRCMTSTADSTDTYANKTLATEQEIAYVENGTTATKTNGYAVGEYFCWHGSLYRAKTAIGNGDTFTENTNCEQVTEGGLNALKSCFPWKTLGIAYNDTPLNTNFASYNELLITPLVNGSVQYGTCVIPVAHLSSTNSLFLSVYESQTHHASLQITTNSAKTQISLAYNGAIAGWNSVAVLVSAR